MKGVHGSGATAVAMELPMSVSDEITPWLRRLGLERYAQAFIAQDVDLAAARLLTDADLRELGVTLGHRKRILQHIALDGSRSAEDNRRNDASNEARASVSLEAAERRLVSVLFCDMVGSTELTHRLDPEDMRQLLRAYQERVAATVSHYGGHLAQYLGDGVMAYFGWPVAFEDQAERAVRAGLDAIAGVASLETRSLGAIRCRAAVASGEVVIGDLSEAGRKEGAIAGDAPALAARLQQLAAPGQLVVSDATRTLVDGIFEVAELGRHALKGFEQPVGVHRVTGVKSLESRFEATRGSRLSRFVGRHGELSLMLEKWGLAKSGMGQAVLLSGEAGIGKSRLLRALTGALGGEPMERWYLQCSPFYSGSTLFPVIHSLNRAITPRSDATATTRLDQLEQLLETWGADVEKATPIFADLLAIDTSGRYAPLDMPPQEMKDAIFATLISHCLAVARRSPLLLVIEDAHWIDPTTLELTEQLVASIARTSLLIIVTHRPEWKTDLAA